MVRKSKPPRNAVVDQDRTFSRSPADDDSNAPSSDHESQDEKDETEIELEKLVFGDDAGFRKNLRPPKAKSYGDEMSVGSESFEEHGSDQHDNEDLTALADADLFFVDSTALTKTGQALGGLVPPTSEGELDSRDPPAWVDSEDERMVISLASDKRLRKLRLSENEDLVSGKVYIKRLRQQFERLHPAPAWTRPRTAASRKKRRRSSESDGSAESSDDAPDDVDDLSTRPLAKLLQSTGPLTQPSNSSFGTARRKLRPEAVDIQRTKDVGSTQPSAIMSVSFHPTHPILLSSGPSSLLTLHHISPTSQPPNPTIHKLSIPGHPVYTSAFHPSGESIFFASRRRYFHTWTLNTGAVSRITRIYGHASEQRSCERFKLSPCGRYMALVGTARKGGGVVNVLDARTMQWLCQARVEGRNGVADLAWWRDGAGLLVLGKGGDAVEYSIAQRAVVARWADEGAVGTTTVALGGSLADHSKRGDRPGATRAVGPDRWAAVGSQSGIVNLYDRAQWQDERVPLNPKPLRTLDQLTTPVSSLVFSDDGQLLVMASRWKRDALRLVHLPSCNVYGKWPTGATPLGRVTAVAMSPGGGLLAVGNEAGKLRMWEIRG